MKVLRTIFMVLLLCAAAYPQGYGQTPPGTEDLGLGAWSNEHGNILLLVDAAMADLQLKNDYVMFILYMASKDENVGITVDRNDVVMVYNGQEYHMPSLKELRDKYKAEIRDVDFYRHLGKEGVISSWVRFYYFNNRYDFFPPLTLRSTVATDEGYMYGYRGFRTKAYFKNPGFKKGDKVTFIVRDKKNPKLTGEVTLTLD